MDKTGLEYAELQFVWDKEVGDLNKDEMNKVKNLLDQYNKKVSCITRHVFAGLSVIETQKNDANYTKNFDGLKRCIEMSQELGVNTVRTMSFRKEMIIFGEHGAEKWNVSKGAWDKLVELMQPVVEYAKSTDTLLVVETGNNAMITSCHLGVKLIQELHTDHLKILWDPANALYCTEKPTPDAIKALGEDGRYLGHLHIKDVVPNMAKAHLRVCEMGQGEMAPYLQPIADYLNKIHYDGVVSLEAVYHPGNGSFEDGFHACLPLFKKIFS